MCLYYQVTNNSKTYVVQFVDDILIVGSDENLIIQLKTQLHHTFKTKDIGLASSYLGLHIEQNVHKGFTNLDQISYLKHVLKTFNMLECKGVSTPLDSNFNSQILLKDKSENVEIENRCRKLIGYVMYAMIGTRPDLCISISILSRFQNCASNDLWKYLKRILRYIKETINLNLTYRKSKNCQNILKAFVDADWGGDTISRKSTTGYCLMVFDCLVMWCSKKQPCIALSSTEAEYVALSQCDAEACWLRNLYIKLKITTNDNLCVTIYEDNQSAISAASNTGQPKRQTYRFEISFYSTKNIIQYYKTYLYMN